MFLNKLRSHSIEWAERTICSHNSRDPPPHAGQQPGHTELRDVIPFPKTRAGRRLASAVGRFGQSCLYGTSQLIPQGFSCAEVWAVGRPPHPLCVNAGSEGHRRGVRVRFPPAAVCHSKVLRHREATFVGDDNPGSAAIRDTAPYHDAAPAKR